MSAPRRLELLPRALELPEDERLRLAEELIISVNPPGVMSVDDAGFAAEIIRRSNSIHDGTAITIFGEEMMKKFDRTISSHSRGMGKDA
jgi:putative addiction module component (TIGR02574 family)